MLLLLLWWWFPSSSSDETNDDHGGGGSCREDWPWDEPLLTSDRDGNESSGVGGE
jgi:hypothetical protein